MPDYIMDVLETTTPIQGILVGNNKRLLRPRDKHYDKQFYNLRPNHKTSNVRIQPMS